MCDAGGIGGILGSIGGGLLDIAFPEVGIPLSLASAAGGFGGTLLGDVATGKPFGQSILPALETGAISGVTAGLGNLAAGGSFFGAPAASLTGLFGGGTADAAASGATTAATTAAADTAAAAAPTAAAAAPTAAATALTPTAAAPSLAASTAPVTGMGGGAAGDIGSIGGTVGSAAPNVAGAVGSGGSTWGADFASRLGGWSGEGLTGGGDIPVLSSDAQAMLGGINNAGTLSSLGQVAGPGVPSGDTALTSSMAPLDSSNVGTLGRGDLSLNLTPGVQTASVPVPTAPAAAPTAPAAAPTATGAPTSLTMPPGYSGLTPEQVNAVNTQGFFMRPDAVTPTAGSGSSGGLWNWLTKAGSSPLSKGLVGEPGSILGDLTKPSSLITGGAALLPLLKGNTIPGLQAYQNQGRSFSTIGDPLAQSLNTGNLPAGAQSSLDAATRAAKAAVRSQYAQMGIPYGSSMEADALAGVDARAAGQKVQMLSDLTKTGMAFMQQATPILQNTMTTRLAQDTAQQQAIARLAAALAGSTGQEKTTA